MLTASKYPCNVKACFLFSHCYEDSRGVCPEHLFIYDLEVPVDFKPVNTCTEVSAFVLKSIPEMFKMIQLPNFKPNSALVVLDFLIRHGFLTPEHSKLTNFHHLSHDFYFTLTFLAPHYSYLTQGMHVDPFAQLSHIPESSCSAFL